MVEYREGRMVLTTPVTYEDIERLAIGDIFYLDGELATARDSAHSRAVDTGSFPVDLDGKVLFHAGPITRQTEGGTYEIVSVGPTTSMRMEKYEYDFVKMTGTRIIIGKGGMKDNTGNACREFGAIHCIIPAGNAVAAATCIEEVLGAYWLDLSPAEAVWHCRVRDFGPLIVTIDTAGCNFFEEKKVAYEQRRREQIELIRNKLEAL